MILTNFTFNIEKSLEASFVKCLKKEVFVEFQKSEWLSKIELYHLLSEIYSDDLTICLQLFFDNEINYGQFEIETLTSMFKILDENFVGKYVYFQTILVEI